MGKPPQHLAAWDIVAAPIGARDFLAPVIPAAVLQQLLDRLVTGVILVDAAARPCYLNRQARTILAEHDGLAVRPDGLHAATASGTQRLRRALALAGRSKPDDGMALRNRMWLSLPRPSARLPLLLNLCPLVSRSPPWVAIFVTAPDGHLSIPRKAIAETFGLTPREAALASLLAEGHPLRDCARLLCMAEGTARNHLKHVFEKTLMHSQAQLVTRLHRFAAPCRQPRGPAAHETAAAPAASRRDGEPGVPRRRSPVPCPGFTRAPR